MVLALGEFRECSAAVSESMECSAALKHAECQTFEWAIEVGIGKRGRDTDESGNTGSGNTGSGDT